MINSNKGFTLVELIIASAISLLVLFTILLAIDSAQKSSAGIERKVTAQQDARGALEIMAIEIRMASYNPTFASGIWRSSSTCSGTATNQAYKGIQEATANSIAVEMDTGGASGDGDGSLDDSNEIIRYNYVSTSGDQYITRETNCGGGQPFLGDSIASGRPRVTRVINNDPAINIPIFRYFDGTGTEIAAASFPAAIPNIRAIDITLAVETDEVDPSTGQRRRMVYSTRVIPRNHAITF